MKMEQEGLILRIAAKDTVTYRLTDRDENAVYILLAFLRYGIRYHLVRQRKQGA